MTSSKAPTIIIGAGFAGLFTALHLTNQGYPHPIVLIDRNERFCFKPLLYDYMSGEMQSYQIHPVYVGLLQGRDISFIRSTVTSVDLESRQVYLADGTVQEYDNLVVTPGSVPAFFAAGAAEHAFTFHSKAEADALKQHLMARCREAVQQPSAKARQSLLTIAIVGGGPVGVELTLTLGDLMPRWYGDVAREIAGETIHEIVSNREDIRIVLLNRSDILNGDVNSRLRDTVIAAMEDRVIQPELIVGATVTAVRPNGVEYRRDDQPERLFAHTVVWTAGTKVHPLVQALPIPDSQRAKRGQLLVKPTLQLLAHPEVFAAGDCAVIAPEEGPDEPLPATAQVAYQQGGAIAQALMATAQQKDSLPLTDVGLRGTVMKLGMGTAVANVFDRYEIVGSVGQTIRQMMYLSLMPTPAHNIRTTLDWIKDDVFQTHMNDYDKIDYTAGYTVEELLTLATAVTWSATAVSMAETGFISDQLESVVLRQVLAGATSKYPDNPLVHALFGHSAKRQFVLKQINSSDKTANEVLTIALTAINQAIAILREKATPEELRDYKDLIYAGCDRVARAAGDGPLDKRRIDPAEAAVLAEIKTALN
ncbi:MAG: NAD(P)/FAD-dependent oxidoreductase [Leptolyngbya sp. SIO1E4]|nr:NAD(P)/FAD-dependent oxidoreductase [Leptolyngbya sp. SIO1E4]